MASSLCGPCGSCNDRNGLGIADHNFFLPYCIYMYVRCMGDGEKCSSSRDSNQLSHWGCNSACVYYTLGYYTGM